MYLPKLQGQLLYLLIAATKVAFFGWVDTVWATSFATGQKVIDVQRFLHTSDGKYEPTHVGCMLGSLFVSKL
jgi:hypothetical protein